MGDAVDDDVDVYDDNGRAGYEEAGPGIRRLSAKAVVIVEVTSNSNFDRRRFQHHNFRAKP
jgi:hypothetical protein